MGYNGGGGQHGVTQEEKWEGCSEGVAGSLFPFCPGCRKERKEARARQRSSDQLRRDGWWGRDWSKSAAYW